MKVCIYGAGAIGGYLGARLGLGGQVSLSAMARGATLAALQQHGFRLGSEHGEQAVPVRAVADAAELGVQDLVIVAVKGPAMAAVAQGIGSLLGPDTVVLAALNGVPWWFSSGVAALGPGPLQSVDPGGHIAEAIAPSRVLGCVVHASTSTPEPGRIAAPRGRGLIIGEACGGLSARLTSVADLLSHAGFEVTQSADVRRELWYKLWGNLTTNPVSALTGATVDRILADPQLRNWCTTLMEEAAQVGERIGCRIEQSPADRHRITASLGAFKTSMLQDVEAGRAIELDGIVTAVHEIAQRVGVATPGISGLLGLTRVFARVRGLYPEANS